MFDLCQYHVIVMVRLNQSFENEQRDNKFVLCNSMHLF